MAKCIHRNCMTWLMFTFVLTHVTATQIKIASLQKFPSSPYLVDMQHPISYLLWNACYSDFCHHPLVLLRRFLMTVLQVLWPTWFCPKNLKSAEPCLGERLQCSSLDVMQRPVSNAGLLTILLLACQWATFYTRVQKLGRKWPKRSRHPINPVTREGQSSRNQKAWVQPPL